MGQSTCAGCGEAVELGPTGRRHKWCSETCRVRTFVAAHPEYLKKNRRRAAERARAATAAKPRPARTCIWCGSFFQATTAQQTLCSKRCRMRKGNHDRKLRDPDYIRRYDETNRERKRERMRAYREANPEKYVYAAYADANRESSQRRRARKKNPDGRVEKISYQMLADRDGWRCHLCGDPIDPAVAWPDPLSRSLDHVVPLSKGGEHVMPNCRLAHLGCNVDKGDRPMGEQLALI